MSETKAQIGHLSTFGIKIEKATTFTKVAEITNLTPPGMTRDTVDATHMESPNGTKEFIAGLAEMGEASVTIQYVPAVQDALLAAFQAGSGEFQITFPNKVTMTFKGIVTGYEWGDIVSDTKMTATLTIKCSGQATLAGPPASGGS
ncbi:phage tail tube protein [Falsirhodobacter halotolerans]|uniref:phage tail tube protein n=1 Tax=Falsirhodobacter halotolerans TaxID=1146892 RepID=UPI001FD39299|nr:phage tail tube protein [Falsirhodobacter halotolerans]MCJ8139355.1 hypothetical protein [Falsirhodobacter halotolerans]